MTEWLVGLALLDVASIAALLLPRQSARSRVPWAVFAVALLAGELAWLWLIVQAVLLAVFLSAGAADGFIGQLALCIVVLSWPVLLWNFLVALGAEAPVEKALVGGLGAGYRERVPADRRRLWRNGVRVADWCKPFSYKHPDVEVLRGIRYGSAGIRQTLDIYRPRVMPEGGCPVLLQIHGGAWMIGDKQQQALPLMNLMASRGWVCVSINYRLSPSVAFPTHLEDCKRALCWIRTQGREYGMNPDFVAVTGGSAGGHLSALMGLTANRPELQPDTPDVDTSIQACIPFYGIYDFLVRHDQHPNAQLFRGFLQDRVMHRSPEEDPALWDLASPVAQVHEDAPPFMIVHGTLDSLAAINDGRVFAQRMRRTSKNPVVFLELPGAEHAFDNLHSPRTEAVIDGVQRFLDWVRAGS